MQVVGWGYLIAIIAVAVIGGLISRNSFRDDWYASLRKPPLTPPQIVFPLAWSLLYVFIFIAGAGTDLLIQNPEELNTFRLLFALQLLLNLGWTVAFFGLRNIALAAVINLVLVLVNLFLLSIIIRYSALNFILFFIYTLWTIFALYLTVGIGLSNDNRSTPVV